jgi:polysaccharide biosynthesis PFTS motif protein
VKTLLRTGRNFIVRFLALSTSKILGKKILQSGYEEFILNQGPQKYFKSVKDIANYELNKLGSIPRDHVMLDVPIVNVNTHYYQSLISFIFIRPPIRRSFLVAEYFHKPIIFPMKSDWIKIFEENGFKFNKNLSAVLWKITNAALILKQISKYVVSLVSYRPFRSKKQQLLNNITYKKIFFHDFPVESLTKNDESFNYKNSLAWIKKNMPDNSNLIACSKFGDDFENSTHIRMNRIYGPLIFKKEIFIVFKLVNFILLNMRNYKKITMLFLNLSDIIEYNRVLYYSEKITVKEVYFNCSIGPTKPLWAYAAESIGISNYMYFYATYSEPRFSVNQVQLSGEWHLATWSNFIVPDEQLKTELQAVIPCMNQTFYIFGMPWWIDCNEKINLMKKSTIVIFDKSPYDSMYLFSLLAISGGDKASYQEKFLSNILKVCKDIDCQILYKVKRSSNFGRFNEFISKMETEYAGKFMVVNEKIAPARLIENADMVISRAGSSTALLAKQEGKKSIIYDPEGIVNPDDPVYRKIPVIQNELTLKNYLMQN